VSLDLEVLSAENLLRLCFIELKVTVSWLCEYCLWL